MAPESLSTPLALRVPKTDTVVKGTADQKVAGIMEGDIPYGLRVLREGANALGRPKLPHLHCAITGAGCQVCPSRMEVDP
eukprot:scaffold740_cov405-Prasinococcus_capsulatus_cf.AAC.2